MNYISDCKQQDLEKFLFSHLGNVISIVPIDGDAGLRSYFRIKTDDLKSYILMDCPTSYCSIDPFIEIANYLSSHQFSSPEIISFDKEKGFMILEDFGSTSVKTILKESSHLDKKEIYYLIMDILIALQGKPYPDNLKIYSNELLLSELSLLLEWYFPYVLKRQSTKNESAEYFDIWKEILSQQEHFSNSIVLKDYHVENMMYLENRTGINSFGLLDFQDALIGSPIYDLVSVLEDARIEVERELALECVKYFAKQKKLDFSSVLTNYHILGAQRNSRILGIFARKSIRDKNDNYLQYIPLVLKYLDYDMSHPIMAKLKNWHKNIL